MGLPCGLTNCLYAPSDSRLRGVTVGRHFFRHFLSEDALGTPAFANGHNNSSIELSSHLRDLINLCNPGVKETRFLSLEPVENVLNSSRFTEYFHDNLQLVLFIRLCHPNEESALSFLAGEVARYDSHKDFDAKGFFTRAKLNLLSCARFSDSETAFEVMDNSGKYSPVLESHVLGGGVTLEFADLSARVYRNARDQYITFSNQSGPVEDLVDVPGNSNTVAFISGVRDVELSDCSRLRPACKIRNHPDFLEAYPKGAEVQPSA